MLNVSICDLIGHDHKIDRKDIIKSSYCSTVISEGILTIVGGKTSHTAVVARQLDKVCIIGCKE